MTGKMLLLDDDPVIRMLVSTIIESIGISVTGAELVSEAQTALNRSVSGEKFRLIISDWFLPDGQGRAVIEKLRGLETAEGAYKDCPVILVSALDEHELQEGTSGLKRLSILRKPFTPAALVAAVTKALEG